MMIFQNVVEAKRFFITKISEEAEREGRPLSELEVKMLWFTEKGSDAKPDYLETAAEFSERYDDDEYEKRISHLLRNAYNRDVRLGAGTGAEDTKKIYQAARDVLAQEDHYLLIMVQNVFGSSFQSWLSLLQNAVKALAEDRVAIR